MTPSLAVVTALLIGPSGLQAARDGAALSLALDDAKSVSFVASVSYSDREAGDESVRLRGQQFRVQAAVPASLRVEALPLLLPASDQPTRFRAEPYSTLVTDGKKMYEFAPASKRYKELPPPNSLGSLKSYHVAPLIHPRILFAGKGGRFIYEGRKEIDGQPVRAYSLIEEHEILGTRKFVCYVSEMTRLPMRISRLEPDRNGKTVEALRTDYSLWELNPKLGPDVFNPHPPEGARLSEDKGRIIAQ